jgi:hypothetical protein
MYTAEQNVPLEESEKLLNKSCEGKPPSLTIPYHYSTLEKG